MVSSSANASSLDVVDRVNDSRLELLTEAKNMPISSAPPWRPQALASACASWCRTGALLPLTAARAVERASPEELSSSFQKYGGNSQFFRIHENSFIVHR